MCKMSASVAVVDPQTPSQGVNMLVDWNPNSCMN